MQHNQAEDETLKQLLVLDKEFREYNTLMKNEMNFQADLVKRLWTVSQRYILLQSSESYSRHQEFYIMPAEDALLQEFADKFEQLRNSNSCRLSDPLTELRKSCNVFHTLISQLDMNNESPLIIGDVFHKPISYFIELLDPLKIDSIEHYKKQLEISEEFEEYLNVGLAYCKCLRSKTTC